MRKGRADEKRRSKELNEMVMVLGFGGLICIFDQHDTKHSDLDAINHLGGLDAQIGLLGIHVYSVMAKPRSSSWMGGDGGL